MAYNKKGSHLSYIVTCDDKRFCWSRIMHKLGEGLCQICCKPFELILKMKEEELNKSVVSPISVCHCNHVYNP